MPASTSIRRHRLRRHILRRYDRPGVRKLRCECTDEPILTGVGGGTGRTALPPENGLLVQRNEPAALVEPLQRLASEVELRRRLGAAALALRDGEYQPVQRSRLIELGPTELAEKLDWP